MAWSLYRGKEFLEPLVFSNGKTQQDVVNEVLDAIAEGYRFIFIKGVCGTGKCLDKNSLIFCKPNDKEYFGHYKISDLVGKEGKIISVNKNGEIIEAEFKNVRNTGKKRLYRLKTKTGREIIASKNHPFLTITQNGIEWLPLEKLSGKSYICLPNNIVLRQIQIMDENKIKILAHLIAEGKLGDKVGSPRYYQSKEQNPEVRKDYENALKNLFPDGKIRSHSKKEVSIVFNNMDTRFGTTNKLRLFIKEFGLNGKRSGEKFIPNVIFNLDNKGIALFLRVLFSCDGSIYVKKNKKGNTKQTCIEYCSISKRLVRDVSLLLSRLGIQHTITSKKFRENPDYAWRICISNQEQIKRYVESIGFIGRKQVVALERYKQCRDHKFTNIDKVPRVTREYLKNKGYSYSELDRFLNYEEIEKLRKTIGFKRIKRDRSVETPCVFKQGKIDFLRQHLRKVNGYIKDKILSFICNKEVIWDKIKDMGYLKEDETYDLEVSEYHNFIANGIIVHNSAIALNIAKKIGRASIVVPLKSLQKQYEEDYTNKLKLIKGTKQLKITILTGRKNHLCLFKENCDCDNGLLPCKIEIKEENLKQIKEYLKQNPFVRVQDFKTLGDVRRKSIAPVCKYWSPIIPDALLEYNRDYLEDVKRKLHYKGLKNIGFSLHVRSPGCGYYDQFLGYINSDVIIFNSKKYELENLMNRKPATEIEIIDECDKFFDDLSNEKRINLHALSEKLLEISKNDRKSGNPENKELADLTWGINNDVTALINSKEIKENIAKKEILELKNTGMLDLLKTFLANPSLEERDELEYCCSVSRDFANFFDETFVLYSENAKGELIANLITINLEKKLKEFTDKNKMFVMMSGTIHSEEVLRSIFGIKENEYKIIEAETEQQGAITRIYTGQEENFRHKAFREGKVTRKQYLKTLSACIAKAMKPILVHVNSFADLPTEEECEKYGITNVQTREKIKELNEKYKLGQLMQRFKNKKIDVLYSTTSNRGADFPGDTCNTIILTKYPYPNVNSLFMRILRISKPESYNRYYFDKARRDFIQRVYRGLRSKSDHIFLMSPDIKVLNNRLFKYETKS